MRFLPLLLGAFCLLECGRPAEPPATTPEVLASSDAPPVTEPTDAGVSDVPVATDVDAAAPKPRSDAKTFACGRGTCASGTETCCQASDQGACIPTLKDGPHGKLGFFKDQWEACDHAKLPYSLSGISRCDESLDCSGNEICCEQFLFSGGSVNLCEAPKKDGSTPCEYGEACIESSGCRQPGTECVRGYCLKPVKNLRCTGAEVCGDGQSCCGDPRACKPHAECQPRDPRIDCAKPNDCIKGQTCVLESERSSYCTGLVDRITPGWWEQRGLSTVCEKTSDCVGVCETKGQRMKCKDSAVSGMKACVCA